MQSDSKSNRRLSTRHSKRYRLARHLPWCQINVQRFLLPSHEHPTLAAPILTLLGQFDIKLPNELGQYKAHLSVRQAFSRQESVDCNKVEQWDGEYILSSKAVARPNRKRLKCFPLVAIKSWIAEPSLGPELVGLEKMLWVMVERPVPNFSHSLGKSATRSYDLNPGSYSRQEECFGQGWYRPSH